MTSTPTAFPSMPTTTDSPGAAPMSAAPLKRVAIIGTAQSWRCCPWQDETLEIWGLNDAYMIGMPRATRWYDLHPVHQMYFRSAANANEPIPLGTYVRPEQHLQWLRTRPMPVLLHAARPDCPTSQTFPKEAVLDAWRPYWPWRLTRAGGIQAGPDYEVSTPSWMLMHAVAEGFQEIHVYGIHLATEWEYIQQRPNFEFLMGVASGRGVKIILPQSAPICRANYQYAFEPKGDLPVQQCQQQLMTCKQEGLKIRQRLAAMPWYRHAERTQLEARLARLDVEVASIRQQAARLQMVAS